MCNPHYGHGPVGEKTVEIIPRDRGSSHTLLLLCSLEGIDNAKIIEGAADMIPTISGERHPGLLHCLESQCTAEMTILLSITAQLTEMMLQTRLLNNYSAGDPG